MNTAAISAPVNGKVNGKVDTSVCPSSKKVYSTSEQATTWEVEVRGRNPEFSQQYAYKCEECTGYHLTHMTPDAFAMSQSRSSLPQPVADTKRKRNGYGTTGPEIARLKAQGLSAKEIAAKLNIATTRVYNYLSNANKRAVVVPITLDSIAQKKRDLQIQLDSLQKEETRLVELTALKVQPCYEGKGLLITKEGNRVALYMPDVKILIEKLMEFVS